MEDYEVVNYIQAALDNAQRGYRPPVTVAEITSIIENNKPAELDKNEKLPAKRCEWENER